MKGIESADLVGFERFLIEEERSEATLEKYLRDVRAFCAFLGKWEWDKSRVVEYKRMLGDRYAVTSANSMLAAVNAFLRFLGAHACCVKRFRVQREVYCPAEKELTRDEYFRLLEAAKKRRNARLALILQTLCGTGIRVSELEYVTHEAALAGEAVVRCKGKDRRVFIVPKLAKRLLRYAREQGICTGALFLTRGGRPISRNRIWKEMKGLCKEAGVTPGKVFPHNLRHLFARTFYRLEKDLARLADVLGHASIDTTRIYIVSTGEEHRQKMERMRLII